MVEKLFAQALLLCEPEKQLGGSSERQEWLSLVLKIQGFLITHGFDHRKFVDFLLEELDVQTDHQR